MEAANRAVFFGAHRETLSHDEKRRQSLENELEVMTSAAGFFPRHNWDDDEDIKRPPF